MPTAERKYYEDDTIVNDPWFKTWWRPAAAWTYLIICLFDFVMAPVFFGWFSWFTKTTMLPWSPLTLQGGGLFHLSFGAIIGIYAWTRTKEKIQLGGETVPPPVLPPPGDIPTDESNEPIYETKPPKTNQLMAARREEG